MPLKNVRLQRIWEELRSSFWFIPGLMVILAVGLSLLTMRLDRNQSLPLRFLWGGGPEGAWELLTTVAGSMVTVAGVTFSITMVVLSQAATQFGTQVLNNFMRSTQQQVVLGTFISTFVYSLLTLRGVQADLGETFVPHLSIFITMVLALASLGLLIAFIHRVALSIQAPRVIADVGDDLLKAIDRIFPEIIGPNPEPVTKPDPDWLDSLQRSGEPVDAVADGYLQAIDEGALLELAVRLDGALMVMHRPGQFIRRDDVLVNLLAPNSFSKEEEQLVQRSFLIGKTRTSTQDVEYAIDQLVEIAVRALAYGVNDPYPALTVVDWLSTAMVRLAGRKIPQPVRLDGEGRPRLIHTRPFTFSGVAEKSFNLIRQKARDDVAVRIRLLEAIADVAGITRTAHDYDVLARQAEMIRSASADLVKYQPDLEDIEERYQKVLSSRPQFAEDELEQAV